jgi:hypothetical protein
VHHSIIFPFICSIVTLMLVAGEPPESVPVVTDRLTNDDRLAFARRFTLRIWPMMAEPDEPGKGCLPCHRDDQANTSPLILSGNPNALFGRLLSDGYFDRSNPSSILARVAQKKDKYRMPPVPAHPWSNAEIRILRTFIEDLNIKRVR